MSGSDGVP